MPMILPARTQRKTAFPFFRQTALALCLAGSCSVAVLAHDATGAARFRQQGDSASFGNAAISASWSLTGQKLGQMVLTDKLNHRSFKVTAPFALAMADGST